jgi:hypothetical protein
MSDDSWLRSLSRNVAPTGTALQRSELLIPGTSEHTTTAFDRRLAADTKSAELVWAGEPLREPADPPLRHRRDRRHPPALQEPRGRRSTIDGAATTGRT